jgi:hypothetical protein
MAKSGSVNKARIGAAIVASATLIALYLNLPSPIVVPAPGPAAIKAAPTKQQAIASLMALPELKTWSQQLEQRSGGTLHGAVIEYDPQPKTVGGKPYWQLSFVENGAGAARSWESFLVAQDGSAILVEDFSTDKILTLEQWRSTRHPMERTSADVGD